MTLNELNWKELLNSIQMHQCTPFIGAGASAKWLPSGREISYKLAKEYNYPFEDFYELSQIAQFLEVEYGNRNLPKERICDEFKNVEPPNFSLEEYRNTPHALLADLDLPIYVTTNYDHFMEEALKSKGKYPVSKFCIWNDSLRKYKDSVPFNIDRYSATQPLVYHLHGDMDIPESLVLSDNDYLNFLSSLSSKGSEIILPPVIRDVLGSNLLLFIGYSLKDINFRLMFRLMSGLRESRGIVITLSPDVANITNHQLEKGRIYLEKNIKYMFSLNTFFGSQEEFAMELRQRWEKYYLNGSYEMKLPKELELGKNINKNSDALKRDSSYRNNYHKINSPYIGLRPFEEANRDLFFGRDSETYEIVSLIVSNRIVLMYGRSGVGKTSIFNASVASELEGRRIDVLPVVRVGAFFSIFATEDFNRSGQPTNVYIFNILRNLKPEIDTQLLINKSLSQFLTEYFPTKKDRTQVLVFDQLEELFSLSYDNRSNEQLQEFFQQIANAMEKNPFLRILFIIREAFLSELDIFANMLPGNLRSRFRLERLNKDQARLAIEEPLKRATAYLPSEMDKDRIDNLLNLRVEASYGQSISVIDNIVNNLSFIRVILPNGEAKDVIGAFVEPTHLQIVCEKLWSSIISAQGSTITQYLDLGDVDKSLKYLYEKSIHDVIKNLANEIKDKERERDVKGFKAIIKEACHLKSYIKKSRISEDRIREWIDNKLISSNETRASVFRGPSSTDGIPNNVIDLLERKSLITSSRANNRIFYELASDRLIKPIRISNQERRLVLAHKKYRRNLGLSVIAIIVIAIIILIAVKVGVSKLFE